MKPILLILSIVAVLVFVGAAPVPQADLSTSKDVSLYIVQSYTIPADGGRIPIDGGIFPLPYDWGDAGKGFVPQGTASDAYACNLRAKPCATIAGLAAKIPVRVQHVVSLWGDISPYDVKTLRGLLSDRVFAPGGKVLVNGVEMKKYTIPVCTAQGQTLYWEMDAGEWRCNP